MQSKFLLKFFNSAYFTSQFEERKVCVEREELGRREGEEAGRGRFTNHFMMYFPGWEVVGAAPGERFLFRTVQRQLDGKKVIL